MEIRVLRYFLAVAREENISRAAEVLHITQPTLSRQISQLEEELGAQLFVRGKRLMLTDAGLMLRRRAEEVAELVDKIETEFAGQGYGKFKPAVGDAVIETLRPIREEATRILQDKAYLESVYKAGAEKASYVANKTLRKVYKKIGFVAR